MAANEKEFGEINEVLDLVAGKIVQAAALGRTEVEFPPDEWSAVIVDASTSQPRLPWADARVAPLSFELWGVRAFGNMRRFKCA